MPKKAITRTTECIRCYMFKKEVQRLEAIVHRFERTEKRLRLLLPIKKEKESTACQTEENGQWTETGTLVDQEENVTIEKIESTVWIPYVKDGEDIYFGMDDVDNHFMGVSATDPELYVEFENGNRRLSLCRLREKCVSLPFPYTDLEIREHANWCSLWCFLEKREPFIRRVLIDQSYTLGKSDILLPSKIERLVHFEFVEILFEDTLGNSKL